MVTNGTRLSTQWLEDQLIKRVQITVDGPEDVHNERRPYAQGLGSFRDVLRGLHTCLEAGVTPTVRVNVDKNNAERMEELVACLAEAGLTGAKGIMLYFAPVVASGACLDIVGNCLSPDEFGGLRPRLVRLAREHGFRTERLPPLLPVSCGAVSPSTYVIEPDGGLQKCWETIGDPAKRVGHLLQDSSQNELHEQNLLKWLDWSPFRDSCIECKFLPICMGGCPWKPLYPKDAAGEQEPCVTWKHNLTDMLDLFAASR